MPYESLASLGRNLSHDSLALSTLMQCRDDQFSSVVGVDADFEAFRKRDGAAQIAAVMYALQVLVTVADAELAAHEVIGPSVSATASPGSGPTPVSSVPPAAGAG